MTSPQPDTPGPPGLDPDSGIRRRARLLALVTAMLGLYFLVPVERGQDRATLLRLAGSAVVVAVLVGGAVVQYRRAASRDHQQVDALVGAIVGVLTTFALAFHVLEVHRPGELDGLATRVDALYFSASTMLTIGYGDVHAVGQTARVVVLVQMALDVVVVATAAGILSSRMRRAAELRAVTRRPGSPRSSRRSRAFGHPRRRSWTGPRGPA